jgi:ArsR family transcriptional regulator
MSGLHPIETPLGRVLEGLRAVAEPTRLRLLAVCATGEWTVSELTQVLGQSQPRVSRHLKVLADAGILERFREGAWVFYRLRDRDQGDLGRRLVALLPASAELELDRRRLDEIRADRQRRAQAYFDRHATAWERVRGLTVADAEVDRALLALVDEVAPARVLDIGTGTGHVLQTLAGRVGYGLGIDLSVDMLAVARAHLEAAGVGNCHVRQGDMYQLPVADGAFDLVVLHQVLHFAEQPRLAIAEAVRVLAPGGRLVVVDLAAHDVEALRVDFAHRRLGFAEGEVVEWLERAGLEHMSARTLPGNVAATIIWHAKRPGAASSSLALGSAVA